MNKFEKGSEETLVSIVIPTFNAEETIEYCLRSLFSLSFPKEKMEIIVVDDSNDRTPEIISQLPLDEYNVRYIRPRLRRGIGYARALGVAEAKGKMVAFTDSDCTVTENWLNHLVRLLSNNGVGGAGGCVKIPRDTPRFGRLVSSLGFPAGGSVGYEKIFDVNKFGETTRLSTVNAVFLKKAIIEAGNFDSNLMFGGEDVDISYRIREKGYKLLYEPQAVVFHKPREKIVDFIKWHFRRGRAYCFFSKKYKKEKYSLYEGIKHYLGNIPSLQPQVLSLLIIMFFFTGLGYVYQKHISKTPLSYQDKFEDIKRIFGS